MSFETFSHEFVIEQYIIVLNILEFLESKVNYYGPRTRDI